MIKIRRNVFETNSSSTHSMTMCSSEQYNQWKEGNLYYDKWNEKFLTKKEVEDKFNEYKKFGSSHPEYENAIDEYLDNEGYYTFDRYFDSIEHGYETFHDEFVTASGEKVIAFGYYGYDY